MGLLSVSSQLWPSPAGLVPNLRLAQGMCVRPPGSSGRGGRQAVAVFQDRPHIGSPYGGAGGGAGRPSPASQSHWTSVGRPVTK